MKYWVLFLFLLFCSLSVVSQSDHGFTWSDKQDENGFNTLVAEVDGNLFLTRSPRNNYYDSSDDVELVKYDRNYQVERSIRLENLASSRYYNQGTIATPYGLLHIYYQISKKDELFLTGQFYAYEDLGKGDLVGLAKFKMKTKGDQVIRKLSPIELLEPFGYMLSKDKSKLLLYCNQEKIGRDRESYYQYKVLDLNNRLSIINEGEFYSELRSDRCVIEDMIVANNGHVNYLIKTYVKNSNTEFINKKPAYAYELHHLTGDTTEYIYDIKVRREFIDHLKIGEDDEGQVYVAGYVRSKPFDDISMLYFLSLDPLGYKISAEKDKYRPRDIAEMTGKKDKNLDERFEVVDVIPAENIVYVVKRFIELDRNYNNNNFNQSRFDRRYGGTVGQRIDISWDLDEVVIEGYSKNSGELIWITTNPRRQVDSNEILSEFSKGYHFLHNGSLYLVYNERPVNIDLLRKKDKLKRTDVPGDTCEPLIARINEEGNIAYRSFTGEKRHYIPPMGVMKGQKSFFLMNARSNYRSFMIGGTDLSVLDF